MSWPIHSRSDPHARCECNYCGAKGYHAMNRAFDGGIGWRFYEMKGSNDLHHICLVCRTSIPKVDQDIVSRPGSYSGIAEGCV